jgi:type II secretory pathway pseudopilin PulG
MRARLERLRRDERGFTVVEAVIAVALTLLITTTALSVLDRAYANNDKIQKKTDAQSQGRQAIDGVTRVLRSQVCANSSITPVVSASGTAVTFYADFSDADPTDIPERHTISLNTTTGVLTDQRIVGGGTADNPTYTATPTTRVLATGISAINATTPVFQYFAYSSAAVPAATVALNSSASPNVASADLPRIARITVNLRATPRQAATAGTLNSIALTDEVYVRLSNPNSGDTSSPDPSCS